MSNVKPGDFAVVTCGQNEGKRVLVLEFAALDNEGRPVDMEAIHSFALAHGQLHRVETLQPMWIEYVASGVQELSHAGYKMHCPDKWLRRIEPPSDADELWRESPTDEELAERLNQAVKEMR